MVRRRQRKTDIPSHRARQYQRVAKGLQESADARKKLRAILQAKDTVSYMGEFYRVEDAMTLLTQLRAFSDWAREVYERRPV